MTIFRVEETGSTNADMLAMVGRGEAKEGDWLVAAHQTAGRGRMGRTWVSAPGNLYASTVIELRDGDPLAHTLSLVCAWALFSAAGPGVTFKWPNDLMVNGKKLAGILLERSGDFVVAGFGVNVNEAPQLSDLSAIDMKWMAADEDADALVVLLHLEESFARTLTLWRDEGFDIIRRLWESEGPRYHEQMRVKLANGGYVEGAYLGLADDGALRLQLASGKVELVHAGDVQMMGEG